MEVAKEKEKEPPPNQSNVNSLKGKSCKGCLYYSSVLKSKSKNPVCVGLSNSVQVQGYFVGESEMEASKEGRSFSDFKYGCLGYSVYLDRKNSASGMVEAKTELPVCVGIELLVDKRITTSDNAPSHTPAPVHNKEDGHGSSPPRTQKPPNSIGDEFLTRLTRNAGLVAGGVAKNMVKVGNHLKERFDDMLYRRPK